jgi:hypothetical protein
MRPNIHQWILERNLLTPIRVGGKVTERPVSGLSSYFDRSR